MSFVRNGSNCVVVLAAMAMIGTAAQAQVRGVTDKEIVVGATLPLTGNAAAIGQGWSMGARVAFEEVNAAGGINGRKIRLILEDDGYVPARTVQNVRKLIDVDNIFAILCTSSSAATLSVIDQISESGAININTLVMNSAIWEKPRPTTFTIGQGYPTLAGKVVTYLNTKNPGLKWGVFIQDDAFGENILSGVQEAMKGSTATVVEVIKYKRGQTDFSAEMLRMKAAGVNAIYSGAVFSEHIAIVKEAKRVGLDAKFAMLFTAHNSLVQSLLGELGQGVFTADTVSALSEPNGQSLIEIAKKHLTPKEVEGINRDTETSYAGATVLIEAIKRCGKDVTKDCVVKELEATKDLKTLSMGPISFGKDVRFSNQKSRVLVNDFANKKFTPVTDYE